ncbi:DUF6538 domain-containing protein [uncultured Novosphingobium sp.]|uniref:DUF6538 domain-containing protein n=1 Tax=uncultured Novosphingobium sp. TaxID=292277 RepID=UPI0037492CB2
MCSYLHRAGNGRYYFRMAIPAKLRPAFGGKREIKQALGTADRDTAKRLIPDQTKAAQIALAAAERAIAEATATQATPAFQRSPAALARERAQWEFEQEQEALLSAALDAQEDERETLEPVMQALEQGREPVASPAEIARAGRLAILHAREMGAYEAKRGRASESHVQAVQCEPVKADSGSDPSVLLDPGILNLWKTEGDKRPKTVAMVKRTAEWFQERMGKLPVQEITKGHVIQFKNKLLAEGQTVANINVRLSHISLLLGWAARNDMVPTNVARETSIPNPQAKKKRRKPFDLAALKAIFGSPVYANGERPAGGKGEAAYWLPVMALYTGARVRELAQLRHGDVKEIEYPDADGDMHKGWFLSITEDMDQEGLTNAIKNDASERTVPIHAKLIELGFIEYVQSLATKKGRIFPDLPKDIYGNPAAKWGEWFGGYLRKVCGVTDSRMTFHSFRHTFKDYARSAKIEEGVQRELMGHEGGDVADQYGSGYALHVLADAMATYRVPGLTIPPRS